MLLFLAKPTDTVPPSISGQFELQAADPVDFRAALMCNAKVTFNHFFCAGARGHNSDTLIATIRDISNSSLITSIGNWNSYFCMSTYLAMALLQSAAFPKCYVAQALFF